MAVYQRISKAVRLAFAIPFIFLIRFYQIAISPFLGTRCRFYPSCSQYALESIKLHGLLIGLWLNNKKAVKMPPSLPRRL